MPETLHSAAATVARWRSAEGRGDVDAAVACLSRDVVLSSPLTALMTTLGPELARRQGRRGLAALMRASTMPIHAMVTFGDRAMVEDPADGTIDPKEPAPGVGSGCRRCPGRAACLPDATGNRSVSISSDSS
ncbi:nuclear transport factor 2 family protein [Streptomyces canus]|uniref:nuclear transport factor 2 family protein n=1 Tax=Streptomyces canus TaxID=58343 RepID=UPI0033AD682D